MMPTAHELRPQASWTNTLMAYAYGCETAGQGLGVWLLWGKTLAREFGLLTSACLFISSFMTSQLPLLRRVEQKREREWDEARHLAYSRWPAVSYCKTGTCLTAALQRTWQRCTALSRQSRHSRCRYLLLVYQNTASRLHSPLRGRRISVQA